MYLASWIREMDKWFDMLYVLSSGKLYIIMYNFPPNKVNQSISQCKGMWTKALDLCTKALRAVPEQKTWGVGRQHIFPPHHQKKLRIPSPPTRKKY